MFVCMYRPIQGLRLWYATHACVWWMLFDSLNIVCTFLLKRRLVWVRQVVYSVRAHLGSRYLHWMPLNPDMFVLHDWLTRRVKITAWLRVDLLNFCTSQTLSRMNTPSFLFPPSFILLFIVLLCALFLSLCTTYLAAALSKPCLLFHENKASFTTRTAIIAPIIDKTCDSSKYLFWKSIYEANIYIKLMHFWSNNSKTNVRK